MRKKIEKKFWDMEIIGNRRKIVIVRKKYGRTLHTLDFPYVHKVLYISFDRFLLAVESRDLSQAGKRIIRVYSFPKLNDGQLSLFFCLSQLRPDLSAK